MFETNIIEIAKTSFKLLFDEISIFSAYAF